jgi:hypothetical protein
LDDKTEASGLGQIIPLGEVDAVRSHRRIISSSRRLRRDLCGSADDVRLPATTRLGDAHDQAASLRRLADNRTSRRAGHILLL